MAWRRIAGLGALGLLAGCYSLQPVSGPRPEIGERVAFDINDAGRVALGGEMGPEIARVEGRLIENGDDSYLIAVTGVELLRGGHQVWSGEQVRLQAAHVSATYEKRFSLGRSLALGTIGIGGFAAFLVTRSLFTTGTDPGDGNDGDNGDARLGRP